MLVSPKWQTMWMESQYCSKSIVQLALPTQQAKKILEDLKTNISSPIKAIQLEALKCWGIWIRNQKEDEWKENSVCYAAARPLLVKKLQPLLKDVDVCKTKLSLMWELIHKVQNLMQLEGPQFILEVFLQSCLAWLSIDGIDAQISGLVFQLLLALFGKDNELIDCDKEMFPALTVDVLGFRKVFCCLADKLLNIIVVRKKVKDKSTLLKIWKCFLEKCENSCENIPIPIWHKIFKILTQICSEENESIEERFRFLHGCAIIPKSVLCSSKFIDHGNLLMTPCEALLKNLIQLCTVEGSNDHNVQLFALSKEICEVLTEKSISFGNYDLCLLVVDFLEEFSLRSLLWGIWCGLVRCFQSKLKHIHRNHYTKIQMKFYRKLRGVIANFDLDKEFLHEDCIFEVKKCMEVLDIQWLCTSCGSKTFNCRETKMESTELNLQVERTKELTPVSVASKVMILSPRPSRPFSKLVNVNLNLIQNIFKTVNRDQLKPFINNCTLQLGLSSTNGITSMLGGRRKNIAALPAICEAIEEEETEASWNNTQISDTEKNIEVSVIKPNEPSLEAVQKIKIEEKLKGEGKTVIEKDFLDELQAVKEMREKTSDADFKEKMKEKKKSRKLNSSLEEEKNLLKEEKQSEGIQEEQLITSAEEIFLETELNEGVEKKAGLYNKKQETIGQECMGTKPNFGEKIKKMQKSASIEAQQKIPEAPTKRNFRTSQRLEEIKIENSEKKVKQELEEKKKLKSMDGSPSTVEEKKTKKKSFLKNSDETGIRIINKKTRQELKVKDISFTENEVPVKENCKAVDQEVKRLSKTKSCPQESEVKQKGVRPEKDEDIGLERQLASAKRLTISEREKLKEKSNQSEKIEVKKVAQSTPTKTSRELSKLDETIQKDEMPSTPKTRSKRRAEEELKRREKKRKNKTFEAVVQEIVRKNKLRKSEKSTKTSPGCGSKKTGEGSKRHLRNSTGKLENYFKVIAKKAACGEVTLTDVKKTPSGWKQTSLKSMMKKKEKLRSRNERLRKQEMSAKMVDSKNLANVSPYKEVFHDHEYVKVAHMSRSGTLSEPKVYQSLPLEQEVSLPKAKPPATRHSRKLKEEQSDVNEEPNNQITEDKIVAGNKVLSIQTKPKIKHEGLKQNKMVPIEKSKPVETENPEIKMEGSDLEGNIKCYEETRSAIIDSETTRTIPKYKPNILRKRVSRNLKAEGKTEMLDSSKPLKDGNKKLETKLIDASHNLNKVEEEASIEVIENKSEINLKIDKGRASESEIPMTRFSRKIKEELKPESVNFLRETRNSKNRQMEFEKGDEKKEQKIQRNLSPSTTSNKNFRKKVEEKVTGSKEIKVTEAKLIREGKKGRKEKEHIQVAEGIQLKMEPMEINFCEKEAVERKDVNIEHNQFWQNLGEARLGTPEVEEPEMSGLVKTSETRLLRSTLSNENSGVEVEKSVKSKNVTPPETRFARKMKEAEKHSPEMKLEPKNFEEVNLVPMVKSTSSPETRFSKKMREVENREEANSKAKEENKLEVIEDLKVRDYLKDKEVEFMRTEATASSKETLGSERNFSGTTQTPVARFLRSKDVQMGVNFLNSKTTNSSDSIRKPETRKGRAEIIETKESLMDVISITPSKTWKKKSSQKIDGKQLSDTNNLDSKAVICAEKSDMADAGKAQLSGTKVEIVKTSGVVLSSTEELKEVHHQTDVKTRVKGVETKHVLPLESISCSTNEAPKLDSLQKVSSLEKTEAEKLKLDESHTPGGNCTILKDTPRFSGKVETELLECKIVKLETLSGETEILTKGKAAEDVNALTTSEKVFEEISVKTIEGKSSPYSENSAKKNTPSPKVKEETKYKRAQNKEDSNQLIKAEPSKPNKVVVPEGKCITTGLPSEANPSTKEEVKIFDQSQVKMQAKETREHSDGISAVQSLELGSSVTQSGIETPELKTQKTRHTQKQENELLEIGLMGKIKEIPAPEKKTTESEREAKKVLDCKQTLDFRGETEVSEVPPDKKPFGVETLEKIRLGQVGEEKQYEARTGNMNNPTESEISKTRFSRRLEALVLKQKTRESQMTEGKDTTYNLQEILTEFREGKGATGHYVNGKGILESEGIIFPETEIQKEVKAFAKVDETPISNSEAAAKTNELATLEEEKSNKKMEIESIKAPSGIVESDTTEVKSAQKLHQLKNETKESLLEESCKAHRERILEDEISSQSNVEVSEVTESVMAKQTWLAKDGIEATVQEADSDKLEKELPREFELNSETRFSRKLKEIGQSIITYSLKDLTATHIENLEVSTGNEKLLVGNQGLIQENYKTEEECPRRGKKRTRMMDSLKPSKKVKLDDEFLEESKLLIEVVEKENLDELEEAGKSKDETPVRTSNGTLSSRALRMIALVPESTKPGLTHREATPRPDASKGLKKGPNVDKNSRASKMLALLSENVILEEDEWAEELTREGNGSANIASTPTSTLRSPNSIKKRKLIRFDDAKNETILYLTDTPPSQIQMLRKSSVQEAAST